MEVNDIVTGRNGKIWSQLDRSEQERTGWMEDIVSDLVKHVELVEDLLSVTSATAEEYFGPPRHRCFVGCEGYAECFAPITDGLVETLEKQTLNEVSDVSGIDEVVDVCEIVDRALERLLARKRMRS